MGNELARSLTLFALLTLLTVMASLPAVSNANPIPSPTIILKGEDIHITFSQGPDADGLTVRVEGIYPFRNLGFKDLDMYFPVPKEAAEQMKIFVSVNGAPVKWEIVETGEIYHPGQGTQEFKYTSALGDLPMIKWHLKFTDANATAEFVLNVTYIYTFKPTLVNAGGTGVMIHKTIYAMATGRFYYYYSKQVTANVVIEFVGSKFNYARCNVTLAPPPDRYNVEETKLVLDSVLRDGFVLKFKEKSALFRGLVRDIVFEIIIPRSMPTTPLPWENTTTVKQTVTETKTVTITETIITTLTEGVASTSSEAGESSVMGINQGSLAAIIILAIFVFFAAVKAK